ncbi:MAG TPA: oxidoreductase [Terriglobales bacterium]
MINVGLVGFGFAGRTFHAPVITSVPGMRLAGVVQRSGDEAARMFRGTKVFRSTEELLSATDIHLVVVATPNQSHFSIAKQCLVNGRHVVVDKPFTTTSEEARELIQIAGTNGRVLSVYHNRRWDGDFQTVRKLASDGALGRIAIYESHFDRFRPELRDGAWRERNQPGSGVLFDLGSHLLDQAFALFGTPEAITADVRIERKGAVVNDAFDITLFYSEMRALLRATMLANTPGARFTLHGTLGSYVKYGMDPQEEALKAGRMPGGDDWGVESEAHWGTLRLDQNGRTKIQAVSTLPGDYRLFYANVRDAIEDGTPLAVTPTDALNVIIALELAEMSSRDGRRLTWPK